jgi:hypothetical protein
VLAFSGAKIAGHPRGGAEGAVTKLLPRLLKTSVLFTALLCVNARQVCGAPQESQSPSPELSAEPAPEAALDPVPESTRSRCPAGQCVLGRTNTIPPRILCGPCRTTKQHQFPSFCPKPLAPGAIVYLNDKPYGHGFDSTPRVKGDPEFCYLIHHVWINDCHLESWPTRTQCEMELMHGCPIWQYTVDGTTIHGCFDDQAAPASCDHFGSVGYQDDPKTPTTGDTLWNLRGFEGRPLQCGLQRNAFGPMAGFFTVAHGIGYVRACKPDKAGCGPWRAFNH